MATAHYVGVVEQNRTAVDVALLTTRLVAGLVMIPHGAQRLFGSFNGPGRFSAGHLLPLPESME